MLHNLQFRHWLQTAVEAYLNAAGFIAVETPILTKSTPEGAGTTWCPAGSTPAAFTPCPSLPRFSSSCSWWAAWTDTYQIARCFRDEDLRADRQPEFTQVDMELSFVEQEDILEHLEKLLPIFRQVKGLALPLPFSGSPGSRQWTATAATSRTYPLRPAHCGPDRPGRAAASVFRQAAEAGRVVRPSTSRAACGLHPQHH